MSSKEFSLKLATLIQEAQRAEINPVLICGALEVNKVSIAFCALTGSNPVLGFRKDPRGPDDSEN